MGKSQLKTLKGELKGSLALTGWLTRCFRENAVPLGNSLLSTMATTYYSPACKDKMISSYSLFSLVPNLPSLESSISIASNTQLSLAGKADAIFFTMAVTHLRLSIYLRTPPIHSILHLYPYLKLFYPQEEFVNPVSGFVICN